MDRPLWLRTHTLLPEPDFESNASRDFILFQHVMGVYRDFARSLQTCIAQIEQWQCELTSIAVATCDIR